MIKNMKILKNGAIGAHIYYKKDKKWKWRILGKHKGGTTNKERLKLLLGKWKLKGYPLYGVGSQIGRFLVGNKKMGNTMKKAEKKRLNRTSGKVYVKLDTISGAKIDSGYFEEDMLLSDYKQIIEEKIEREIKIIIVANNKILNVPPDTPLSKLMNMKNRVVELFAIYQCEPITDKVLHIYTTGLGSIKIMNDFFNKREFIGDIIRMCSEKIGIIQIHHYCPKGNEQNFEHILINEPIKMESGTKCIRVEQRLINQLLHKDEVRHIMTQPLHLVFDFAGIFKYNQDGTVNFVKAYNYNVPNTRFRLNVIRLPYWQGGSILYSGRLFKIVDGGVRTLTQQLIRLGININLGMENFELLSCTEEDIQCEPLVFVLKLLHMVYLRKTRHNIRLNFVQYYSTPNGKKIVNFVTDSIWNESPLYTIGQELPNFSNNIVL